MSDEFDRRTLPDGATQMSDLPPREQTKPPPALTVGKLKELLKDVPDEFVVYTEGCDCVGQSDGIEIESDNTVLVTRL